uniref:Uncharacterized protein MANES_05G041300 n=1 Tax=Rhizophora mucronata TaxID=61149 RepID=A0A2P2K5G8_RHIMU
MAPTSLCLTQLCFFPAIRGQSSTCTDECLKKWSVSSSWVPMIPSVLYPKKFLEVGSSHTRSSTLTPSWDLDLRSSPRVMSDGLPESRTSLTWCQTDHPAM